MCFFILITFVNCFLSVGKSESITAVFLSQTKDNVAWSVCIIEKSANGLTARNGENNKIHLIFDPQKLDVAVPLEAFFEKIDATPYFSLKDTSPFFAENNRGLPLIGRF